MSFVDVLFPGGKPLFYLGTFNGKPFSRQWTTVVSAGSGHKLWLGLELDARVVGQGNAVVKQRAMLELDAARRPVRYRSEAGGAGVVLEISGGNVTVSVPDGSHPKAEWGNAEFITEANM